MYGWPTVHRTDTLDSKLSQPEIQNREIPKVQIEFIYLLYLPTEI